MSAILFQFADITDAESRHRFCPPGEGSWCKCEMDIVTGKSTNKKTMNLPKWTYLTI